MQLKILIQNYPAAYPSMYAPFHYLNTALDDDDVRPIPSLSFIISCPLLHQQQKNRHPTMKFTINFQGKEPHLGLIFELWLYVYCLDFRDILVPYY